jgi:hypothetical protein
MWDTAQLVQIKPVVSRWKFGFRLTASAGMMLLSVRMNRLRTCVTGIFQPAPARP